MPTVKDQSIWVLQYTWAVQAVQRGWGDHLVPKKKALTNRFSRPWSSLEVDGCLDKERFKKLCKRSPVMQSRSAPKNAKDTPIKRAQEHIENTEWILLLKNKAAESDGMETREHQGFVKREWLISPRKQGHNRGSWTSIGP